MKKILKVAFCCVFSCIGVKTTYASLAISHGAIQQTPVLSIQDGLQNGKITSVADFEKNVVSLLNSNGDVQDLVPLRKIKNEETVQDNNIVRVVSLYQYQIGDRSFDLSSENEYPVLTTTQSNKDKGALKEIVGTCTYYENGKQKNQLSLKTKTVFAQFVKLNSLENLSINNTQSTVVVKGSFKFSDGEVFEGATPKLPILYKTRSWERIGNTINFQEKLGGYTLWNDQQEIDLSVCCVKDGKNQQATTIKKEHLVEEKDGKQKFGTQYNSPENKPFWVYRFHEIPVVQNPQQQVQQAPAVRHESHGPSNEFERFGRFVSNDCSMM